MLAFLHWNSVSYYPIYLMEKTVFHSYVQKIGLKEYWCLGMYIMLICLVTLQEGYFVCHISQIFPQRTKFSHIVCIIIFQNQCSEGYHLVNFTTGYLNSQIQGSSRFPYYQTGSIQAVGGFEENPKNFQLLGDLLLFKTGFVFMII